MELILISESKLKIMLSAADMNYYELNTETIDYDNTETRKAFWDILDEAKHRTGFDAASDRVFIQVYPSKEGGCELFVTKLGNCITPEGMSQALYVPGKAQKKLTKERKTVYGFEDMRQLLLACKAIKGRQRIKDTSAWKGEDGKCYLVVSEETEAGTARLQSADAALEFGDRASFYGVFAYINEHCMPICEHSAAQCLGELA